MGACFSDQKFEKNKIDIYGEIENKDIDLLCRKFLNCENFPKRYRYLGEYFVLSNSVHDKLYEYAKKNGRYSMSDVPLEIWHESVTCDEDKCKQPYRTTVEFVFKSKESCFANVNISKLSDSGTFETVKNVTLPYIALPNLEGEGVKWIVNLVD